MPKRLQKEDASATETYAKFVADPFETGYGHTIGNSLRRVLLSSLEGAAITSVKIDGAMHEFTTIDGVVEDVTDLVLNLKKLLFKSHVREPQTLLLSVSKEGPILAGDIQLTYATPISAYGHLKSGRLTALAVAGPARFPTLPDVPTAAEAGLAGYEIDFWYALLGPAGMAPALVGRIQRDVAAVLLAPEMRDSLLAQGCIAVGGRPEELTALIKNEYARWSRVVQAGGVKVD